MKSILCILILLLSTSCRKEKEASGLQVDHVNIWVDNPTEAKNKLVSLGFTSVPDSLSQVHAGQGTTGRYFYFLNMYLELIFIHDSTEFQQNASVNNQLDFLERSNHLENGFSPFSIALKMEEYDEGEIPYEVIGYAQEWMGEDNKIYVARNSKTGQEEPSIFIVYPEIEYDIFESTDDLSRKIPEEYSIWRSFYKHTNGVEKVTKVKIYSNNVNNKSETVQALQQIENIELLEGETYLMELYFDDQKANKSYDLRPELPIMVYF